MSTEWRLFLPFPSQQTCNEELLSIHSNLLETLDAIRDGDDGLSFSGILAGVIGSSEDEIREDEYAICKSHFGLKKRHQKKVELKIRKIVEMSDESLCGIDVWHKFKLGKNSPEFYREIVIW